MAQRKLKKRNYLGEGFVHVFLNDSTGEEVVVPCTKEDYVRMGEKGGGKFNPTLDGHTWECSLGGTYKVDTENTLLGEDEYCEVGEEKIVNLKGAEFGKKHQKIHKDAIDDSDFLDEDKLEKKLK